MGPPGEVDRGVEVPIQDHLTALAAVGPLRERQLLVDCPAHSAGLGAGLPAVGHHQFATVPLAYVGQLAAELIDPGIRERWGQPAGGPDPIARAAPIAGVSPREAAEPARPLRSAFGPGMAISPEPESYHHAPPWPAPVKADIGPSVDGAGYAWGAW